MNPEVKAALLAWCDTMTPDELAASVLNSPNAEYFADPSVVVKYLLASCQGAV